MLEGQLCIVWMFGDMNSHDLKLNLGRGVLLLNDFILELQKSIDKNIEKTEEERNRLIELVKSLEIKLNSIEQSATEEQWSFRQKSASLEAEKVSFEREKTFTREKLQAEEKRIQVLNQAKNVCF